ncbi:MAG: Hpt domain-containing protein [Bacteroidales bacterium]|jgi:HPt (histidine-containing phosphotransfer) domain-containing protein
MKSENLVKLDNLIEMSGSDKSFISEIFKLFLSHAETYITDSENAFANNDYPQLKKIAHKFKSSVQLFEITELVALLHKVEDSNFPSLKEDEKKRILKKIKEYNKLACAQIKEIRKDYS